MQKSNTTKSTLNIPQNIKDSIRIFIIHGYDAYPSKHWFMWLKECLLNEGIKNVEILAMPNAASPKLAEWIEAIRSAAGKVNQHTFFVGHSLGCISILRYIETLNENETIGGITLVSGFYETLNILPALAEFTQKTLDFKKIIRIAKERTLLCARDDYIVPCEFSQNLAKAIKATLFTQEKGGHFMQDDGFKTLPIVLEMLKEQINENLK